MSFLNRTLNTVNWRRTSCDHTNNCFKVNCCIHHSSLPVPDVVSLQLRSTTPSFLPSVHGIKKWRENSKAASLQIHVRMYLLYVYGLLSLSLSIPEADFFSGSRSLPLSLSLSFRPQLSVTRPSVRWSDGSSCACGGGLLVFGREREREKLTRSLQLDQPILVL